MNVPVHLNRHKTTYGLRRSDVPLFYGSHSNFQFSSSNVLVRYAMMLNLQSTWATQQYKDARIGPDFV